MSSTALRRRYLALWFPFLTAERWRHEQTASDPTRAVVFAETAGGASRIAAMNRAAARASLTAGMTLADARARLPAVHAVAMERAADARWLRALAGRAEAFTPSVALDEPHGLLLDLTGCSHLHGGEAALLDRFDHILKAGGAGAHGAIGATPDMARALARFGPRRLTIATDAADARALPIAALEANEADSLALRRAGLRCLADIAARPSVLFTSRFGAGLTVKLGRILGAEDRRITPLRAPEPYVFDYRCAEPIARDIEIMAALDVLVQRAACALEERGEGGRTFAATFFRSDGETRSIAVRTGAPTRAADLVLRLCRERLDALADPLDPGFGYDAIRLAVPQAETMSEAQTSLDARDQRHEEVSALCDRLAARFGASAIFRLACRDAHLPEQAQATTCVLSGLAGTATASVATSAAVGTRPLHLFAPPHLLDMEDVAADGAPLHFRWRRLRHTVVRAQGPERIAAPWWIAAQRGDIRDYYRVEIEDGRRYWLFQRNDGRAGENDATTARTEPPGRWYLHGVFA